MHEPWRLVLLTMPDGATAPARVWLPPLSGVDGELIGSCRDRHVDLPVQRVPHSPAARTDD